MSSGMGIIGATPLTRLMGPKFDSFQAYLKDESTNPYGTIKDRRNKMVLSDALRLGVDKLALISSGNNAYSLAKLANREVKVTAIVDVGMSDEMKKVLANEVYQLIEINLQHKILRPEEVITIARERDDEVIWDVTNGYEEYYEPIISELIELDPDYVVTPIGSGAIYIGLIQAVARYHLKTVIIGIGVQNTIKSYADKLHTPWTPYAKIMTKYMLMGNPIYRLSEGEIKTMWQQYQYLANSEPSSTVVFAAIHRHQFKESDKVVFINSGKLLI